MLLIRFLVLFSLTVVSCSRPSFEQKQLEHALDFAASNRGELEKVLQHYAHDSLKLEAAKLVEVSDTPPVARNRIDLAEPKKEEGNIGFRKEDGDRPIGLYALQ